MNPVSTLHNVRVSLEMIKWEHSVFALPFALCGAMLAARGWPSAWQLLWIVVAMVSARSAAMAFNRYADAEIDAANPRTRSRAVPAGILSKRFVGAFVIAASAIFIFAATLWNFARTVACAGYACCHADTADLRRGVFWIGEAGDCRSDHGGHAAGLRAFARISPRPVEAERCILHDERRHCGRIIYLRCGRLTLASPLILRSVALAAAE